MIDAVAALSDINFQRVLWPSLDPDEDGFDRIPTGAPWATARGMRRQRGVPCRFQCWAHQRLPCPFMLGGDPKWTLFGTPTFGYPYASAWRGLTIKTQVLRQSPPSSWREGLHAIDARRMLSTVILADPTHREPSGIPRLHSQLLQFACCADSSTLRSSVNPLLEAEDLPLHFLPRTVLPGHHQGRTLCMGALPLTHHFTLQDTGPTSAYPGHSPRPWLLRASSSPAACGWYLLREPTGLTKGCWGFHRSQFPGLASVGRCFPPGWSAVHTGQ